MMNLTIIVAVWLFAQCTAYQLPTLRRSRRLSSSIFPISLPGALTRLTVSSLPCPPLSSWCLFSTVDSNGDKGPALPSLDFSSNQTALDYFNNTYFFMDDSDRDSFIVRLDKKVQEKKNLTVTLDEFFQTAWGEEQADREFDLTLFFTRSIYGCRGDKVLMAYKQWKQIKNIREQDKDVNNCLRMVSLDFQIKDSNLSHTYDLECFSKRVDHLFQWRNNVSERESYVAPYFCFVQSSGMGKTKIMYEYKKKRLEDDNVTCFLIIPPDMDMVPTSDAMFYQLDLLNKNPENDAAAMPELDASILAEPDKSDSNNKENEFWNSRREAERIFLKLDDILNTVAPKKEMISGSIAGQELPKVALLFDESQSLLKKECGLEAFRFRCVRLWLREKRNLNVVAVFAGTNSRFANFLYETEDQLKNFLYPSRVAPVREREYYDKGQSLYIPFFRTTTMGSCLPLLGMAEEKKGKTFSEYDRAVFYGRPLFALMANENKLDANLGSVLRRMLCTRPDDNVGWNQNRLARISLLSTRVQMGQTTSDLSSDLVAYGYANFCGYYPESRAVRLGYFPDPVCARLAMCMMDSTFQCKVSSTTVIKGEDKKWWTETLKEIFSTGLVSPEKGNFGEVVVALYMLFCGDLLRNRIDEENMVNEFQVYSHFSVPLDAWLQTMMSGGTVPDEPMNECDVSVGFIQVCRNFLRSYRYSWKTLAKESFLKHIFESGLAFYVYQGCSDIDMVVPLRIRKGGESSTSEFVPMFVSIKCLADFSDEQMNKSCYELKCKAESDNLPKALCLLISFGSKQAHSTTDPFADTARGAKPKTKAGEEAEVPIPEPIDYALKEGEKISQLVSGGGIVARTIRIPLEDVFGLTNAFKQMTPAAEIDSEVFSFHTYLMAHGLDGNADLDAEVALRKYSYQAYAEDFKLLKKAMTGGDANDAHNNVPPG